MPAKIAGTGYYLPKQVLTNQEIAKWVDTSDDWIRQRVGIISRHIASENETNVFMAEQAAKKALAEAKLDPKDLDLIIVATSTPDSIMPSTACEVQHKLGVAGCPAFDVNAACSGFIYALSIVHQFFLAGTVKHVLIIGSERMSRVINWQDRSTCVLFGDGAGAVVLSASDQPGILGSYIHADGQHKELLHIPNHLPDQAFAGEKLEAKLTMQGNKVFRYAVTMLEQVVLEVLEKQGLDKSAIDWLVPHQANERIIAATAKNLGLSMDKVILTLPTQGNTSAASIPLALAYAIEQNKIKRGELLLLEAFGAGFVWGAALIRY
ncbi:MAG: 3-oxoacyl-ACP synthase [Gammaproteobacteria bacterium]|jgi:3-oxoacyl-[acyl-carrier-protein] synthase-3|nr:3-oxoacyl-ACP synthase [Gammaproteobacteria bacterium]